MTADIAPNSDVLAIRSIRDALRWAAGFDPRGEFVNAVTQDEITIDVIVRVDAQTYVVFDTT